MVEVSHPWWQNNGAKFYRISICETYRPNPRAAEGVYMKKVLFLFAGMLFSSMAFSDPALFEMRLGGTTESELKSVYSVQLLGVSPDFS